jgi:hypothetical protein
MKTFTKTDLERQRKFGNVIESAAPGGVCFDDWLVNINGAGFALYREPHHTDAQIDAAKRWLRSNRDVVALLVYTPAKEEAS